jgi:hypothetical protein
VSCAKGKYSVKTPIHGGTYHARIYGLGAKEPCATSNSITVADSF